jgi:hypothetical protein
MTGGRVGGARL